jgi:hypothetical protein
MVVVCRTAGFLCVRSWGNLNTASFSSTIFPPDKQERNGQGQPWAHRSLVSPVEVGNRLAVLPRCSGMVGRAACPKQLCEFP